MVKDSFKSCAITSSTDGCDDDSIHCFKPGQPCEVLLEEMEKFVADRDRVSNEDPFASDDDGEEDEANDDENGDDDGDDSNTADAEDC